MGVGVPARARRDDSGYRVGGPLPSIFHGPLTVRLRTEGHAERESVHEHEHALVVAPVLLAAASQAAAQSGDWTTYGGNDWNQRYSTLKTITTVERRRSWCPG